MTINLSHKAIISLQIEPFFKEMPTSADQLSIFINELFEAVREHKTNYFSTFARLFRSPEYFFGLDLMGPLTKGEAIECIIDILNEKINKAATNAGTTVLKLNWNKEKILEENKKREDYNDNLICQTTEHSAGLKLDTLFQEMQKSFNQTFANDIRKNIKFERDIDTPNVASSFTIEDISSLRKSLLITDEKYIHSIIDSIREDSIENFFSKEALGNVANCLPDKYSNLKKYFEDLEDGLTFDVDSALSFFYTEETALVALAFVFAIGKKENIQNLIENASSIILELQIQDKIKDAFISHVKLDIEEYLDLQKESGKTEQVNTLSMFSVNTNKINSVLKCFEKGQNVTEPGSAKVVFEKLTIGELQVLAKTLAESENKNIRNIPDTQMIIKNRVEKIMQDAKAFSITPIKN